MGLHQKITDRTTSEPCDCGSDDDHSAEDSTQLIQQLIDEHIDPSVYRDTLSPEERAHFSTATGQLPLGLNAEYEDDVWTDGNE